ncbi:hypothetical protein C2845_PM15G16220 [Panicum miliaceum]|uniref:H15 domain-containing protein n=1 Tax=Panicum miliaceum TaxID=4540 RepID=A0A3L6QD52_PANMI|nr:hypothetical protein C2845_PM15G16220 [Panicum miliaceum]
MAAVVEVDAGQAAKRSKATEEKGKTPPPHPVGALRKQRQPTPDHPPYCWMIGEAIDELCEDGGSEEDSISAFIRARHPGVPPAHDRLLRHYLEKHVVEGFFVCTAAGRYLRSPEENTDVELPVEQAAAGLSEEACVGSPVAEARKDGARLGMATATNSSGKALVPGQKDSSDVPYTTDKELALVIMGNGSATTSIMDKACTEATPTTSVDGGQPLELALVTTTHVPVPVATPAIDNKKDDRDSPSFDLALVAKTDDICRASTSPESSSQACELLVAADDGSVPVLLVADKDGVEEAPYATNKSVRQPRKVGSVPTAGKKDGGKAPSTTPKGHRRQCTPAALATDRSAPTPVAGKKAGRKVSFASPKLTPVTAGGCSTPASVANQDGIQARKLYPATADEIPDDPACCLLALPCLTPAAANA